MKLSCKRGNTVTSVVLVSVVKLLNLTVTKTKKFHFLRGSLCTTSELLGSVAGKKVWIKKGTGSVWIKKK